MVFGGIEFNDDQYRWHTYDDAERGHACVVAEVRAHYESRWRRWSEGGWRWIQRTWARLRDEDEWDWSTLRWVPNIGAHSARLQRMTKEMDWATAQISAARGLKGNR